jgi:hypothetical protein
MQLRVETAPADKFGSTPRGERAAVSIRGGRFDGPRLQGAVLPGGSDWTLLRGDGALELELRLGLKTDDGALIAMTSFGLRHGPPEVLAALARGEPVAAGQYYFRTTPRFETADARYAFLNALVAIATGDRLPSGPVYTVHELL